ncbi:hypothetical protein [Actinoplanes sp. NPDC089786]|uniref:hypothetical protein n=1 Tax=Actinoplanes sp. NPDC089786 TaxID=3155185 RepID=UPI003433A534
MSRTDGVMIEASRRGRPRLGWRIASAGLAVAVAAVLTVAVVGRAGELPAGEKSEMRRRSTAADAYAEVG